MSDSSPSPAGDLGPSIVRTVTPYLVGWLLSALALAGVTLDDTSKANLTGLIAVIVGSLYYVAVRWLEQRWPALGVLLGSRKQPTYVNAKTIPGEVVEGGSPLLSSDGVEWGDH